MIVKKFEARSMREALEMIKKEFGPDAIILKAKDNSNKFGLLGQGSVEVTAAISESALEKKKLAEQKLPDQQRELFSSQPAKVQKKWVQELLKSYEKENINNDHDREIRQSQNESKQESHPKGVWRTIPYIEIKDEDESPRMPQSFNDDQLEVSRLKKEIDELKNIISNLTSHKSNPIKLETPSVYHELKSRLIFNGLSEVFAEKLIQLCQKEVDTFENRKMPHLEGWLIHHIQKNIRLSYPDKKFHFFLGSSGSGRTTLLIKFATFLLTRERKNIALINTDLERSSSHDNLKKIAHILNVPIARVYNRHDWDLIKGELAQFDAILVDLPALKSDAPNLERVGSLLSVDKETHVKHLVLNCISDEITIAQTLESAKLFKMDTLSFTHVDEAIKKGRIYEILEKSKISGFSISYSPSIASGFELMSYERLIDFVLGFSRNPLPLGSENFKPKTLEDS